MRPATSIAMMVAGLLLGLFSRAAGQTDEDLLGLSLEEILNIPVTSVSKTEKPVLENAVMAMVVSREEIREAGYRDLLDILRDLPGVYVVDLTSSEHAASEVLIRGIEANTKMLFLLDGQRISAPTGEPFTFLRNIPLVSVRQVEVTYGPAASLYGADAIGGIVNIVTETNEDTAPTEVWFGTGTSQTYEAQARHRVQLGDKATLHLTGGFFSSQQEDLGDAYPKTFGEFEVDPSLQSHSLHAKLEAGALEASYLRLFGSRNNGIGFQPSLYDYSGNSTWDLVTDIYTAGWRHETDGAWSGRAAVEHYRNELEPTSTYSYDFSGSQEFEDHSFYWKGESTHLSSEVQWQRGPVTWLSGGLMEWFQSIPKTDVDYPLGSYDIHYRNVGAFSQIEATPTSWFHATAGVRFDNDSRFDEQWNPRVAALIHPMSGLRLHASWGTAYLAPAPHKMYERWGVIEEGEYVHLPNPELAPEVSETFQLGVDWFPSDRSRLVLSGFRTVAEDLWRIEFRGPIEIDGVNVVHQTNANVAESTIQGAHVSGTYNVWNRGSFFGHYTLTDGTQTAADGEGTVDLNHMPRQSYLLGAEWSGHRNLIRLVARGFDHVVSNEANTELAGAKLDGVWTTDLFAERRLGTGWDVRVGVDVRNVFDKSYSKISKFDEFFFSLPTTPQPRRSVSVFLRGSF